MNATVKAFVLESTSAVLTIGKRCQEERFSFYWPAGEAPYMVNPAGETAQLEIINNIPYLRSGANS